VTDIARLITVDILYWRESLRNNCGLSWYSIRLMIIDDRRVISLDSAGFWEFILFYIGKIPILSDWIRNENIMNNEKSPFYLNCVFFFSLLLVDFRRLSKSSQIGVFYWVYASELCYCFPVNVLPNKLCGKPLYLKTLIVNR